LASRRATAAPCFTPPCPDCFPARLLLLFAFTCTSRELPMDDPAYEPLYLQGIEKFNECDYYESHEVWEELWTEYRGDSRKFYQGLIQAAVALYHFGNGNIRGARKLHKSVHGYLEPYGPHHLGLDVVGFLASFDTCLADVAASTEDFPSIELNPDLLPEIHLDPPPPAG